MQTVGVGVICRNNQETIKDCIDSFIDHVDQLSIVFGGKSTDKTEEIVKGMARKNPKIQWHNFEWVDDFAAARNYSFSFLNTDWYLWVDADDTVVGAENLRKLAEAAAPEIGAVWFKYKYSTDEFGNITNLYERERLLRAKYGWVWRSRLHETVSPMAQCQYVRSDDVLIVHSGHRFGEERGTRNFRILYKMLEEDPTDKRVWLYLGHQHFASGDHMKAAEWYLKFGSDPQPVPIERYQALCYCSKAMREYGDPQAVEVALHAMNLFPEYRDAYLELAHSYFRNGEIDKAIHFALLSDTKDLIKDPPAIIFVNPLDYSYGKYGLLCECYANKKDYTKALEYLKLAYQLRPLQQNADSIAKMEMLIEQEKMRESLAFIVNHLITNKEYIKLKSVLDITPFWYRDTDEYPVLENGIKSMTQLENAPDIVTDGNDCTVSVAKAYDLEPVLKELDEKYDKVTVVSPFNNPDRYTMLSKTDMERLIISSEGRHVLNLHATDNGITCEYDKKIPSGLLFKFYIGQGLEHWNPRTIKEIGCGGSETWAAKTADALTKKDNQCIIYAMDDEVWDGVLYRHHSKFNPDSNPCNVFISSRIPELFDADIQSKQKWLWVHDVHCFDRLTPEIASRLDAIVCLSKWHVEHIKRTYPFLEQCEVLDYDNHPKTYDDLWTPATYYQDETCARLPKMAIIGNGIDIERFDKKVDKVPNSFIWCSSADRGLEELLQMWPLIRKELPDATLNIFYGWNYFNSTLHIPAQREFKARILELIKQDGVTWRDRVGQDDLAIEMLKSQYLLYPPHPFRETYGISFLEAQAAGITVIYRENGALGETIGDRGIPVSMDATPQEIIDKIKHNDWTPEIGKLFAIGKTWDKQAEKILKLYDDLGG